MDEETDYYEMYANDCEMEADDGVPANVAEDIIEYHRKKSRLEIGEIFQARIGNGNEGKVD